MKKYVMITTGIFSIMVFAAAIGNIASADTTKDIPIDDDLVIITDTVPTETTTTMTETTTSTSITTTTMVTTTTTSTSSTTTSLTTTTTTTTETTTTAEETEFETEVTMDNPDYYSINFDITDEPYIEQLSEENDTTTTTVATTSDSTTEETEDDECEVEEDYDTSYSNETYLGYFRITGYVSSGTKTASGTWPAVGRTIAMNKSQLNSLGLEWGDTIRIDGIGTFTLEDCGCKSGVIDIYCNSVSACYDLTSHADAYLVN